MMPGEPRKLHPSLFTCLDQRFERTAAAERSSANRQAAQVVKLPEVEVIGTRSLETLVKQPERAVAGAVVGLGGQKNLAATLAERAP